MKHMLKCSLFALSLSLVPALQAQAFELRVFGPSGESVLGGRLAPEIREPILAEVLAGFVAEDPAVTSVSWDYQGTQDVAIQRLMTARLAGEQMDVLYCTGTLTNGNYVNAGIVQPIGDLVAPFLDRFRPEALDDFTINGQLYAIPLSDMSSSAVYYNADLFERLGLTPPETYEELLAVATVIEAEGVQPLIHQGANAVMWPMWYFQMFYQASEDPVGKTFSNLAGTTSFTDEPDVEAFRLIARWVEDGILSRDSLSVSRDGMRSAFATGQSAMYFGGTWEIPALLRTVTDFEWSVFPFPQMPDVPGTSRSGGGADRALCIPSDVSGERREAAVRFMEYVSRPEIASLYLVPEVPLYTSVIGVPGADLPGGEVFREEIFPRNTKFLDWVWPTAVTRAVASAVAGVVAGQLTPEDAAASVQGAYDLLVSSGEWTPPQP